MSEIQSLEKQVEARKRPSPWFLTLVCFGAAFVGASVALVPKMLRAETVVYVVNPPAPPVALSSEASDAADCDEPESCETTLIHSTLLRSQVEEWLSADSQTIIRTARIVPSIKNGAANGFKVYSIPPGGPLAVIGIRNGDTIHSVAGVDLVSPDNALRLYSYLSQTEPEEISIELTRDGCPVTMTLTLL